MAKTKKKNLAEKIHSKKLQTAKVKKQLNPFEVHINKEKMNVLGRKTKNDRGLPGVSRAKAINKRKHTLLQEYKQINKKNKFNDRRIGEHSKEMTEEDKIMARFTAFKKKTHKKSIFNLADDEILTHKGQTLSEIENFDDPRSDDDDDSLNGDGGGEGKLGADFVDEAHFGGGILKKTQNEGYKTHKELIDELIAESKKRKAEKQKAKEATLELTEKLDTEWKDLLPLVSKNGGKTSNREEEEIKDKPKVDDFDKLMRELKFEATGTVSDRLKTEEEIAREEKEKLEKMEQERLERMKGFTENDKPKINHKSADDLDDDFIYEADEEYALSYNKEGEANVNIGAEINGKLIGQNLEKNDEEDKEDEQETDDEEEEGEEESGSESDSDDLSDLKADSSESEEEEKTNENDIEKEVKPIKNNKTEDKIKVDLLKRKEIMDEARKELPYTFSLPNVYEDLQKLLEKYKNHEQGVIIERMIKCNHPKLAEGNKENLNILFVYMLQYINDLAVDATNVESIKKCFDIFQYLAPVLYDLAHYNPENAHNSIKEVIKEKHEEFRKNKKKYPGLELLLLFKIVSFLFSTSDFRHQIVTPSLIFMGQILTKSKVLTKANIAYGLFIITLILEYTFLSKRYFPPVINYLGGLIHMAIPKKGVKLIKVLPPFKSTNNHLVLINKYTNNDLSESDLKMNVTDLIEGEINENFKVKTLYTTLKLIKEFDNNFENLSSNVEIFSDILNYLKEISIENYPDLLKKQLESTIQQLESRKIERKLIYIVMEAKRPKALRLYEPKVEEVFDYKKHKVQSKEKAERDKLLHKLKKETKGALREIRRDKDFLSRVKVHQKLKSDKERREKVKRIYAEAAMQQSELNELERKSKKKKK